MAVRSKPLASGSTPSTVTAVTVYTVPAGKTAILRFLSVNSSGTGVISWGVVRAGVPGRRQIWSESPAANSTARWDTWVALGPGDALSIWRVTGANDIHYFVSGAELLGVAT